MCNIVSVLLWFLIIHFSNADTTAVNCTTLKHIFAEANSEFSLCAVENSRPIKLCEGCVDKYVNVVNSYKNLSQLSDTNVSCIKNFVNKDRLQIIQTLYGNTVDLWTRAKCYECFEIVNGDLTPNLSNETSQFNKYYGALMECVNGTYINDTTLCKTCMDHYLDLNDYYISISNENEKIGVCMDIVDLMNTTRSFWSDKCCKSRFHEERIFMGAAAVVFVIAAQFYVLAKFFTDKKLADILPQSRFMGSLNTLSDT